MVKRSLYRKAAIVGIGETDVGVVPGKTAQNLQIEACVLAIKDAGLTNRDIDGVMTGELRFDPYYCKAATTAAYLGIKSAVNITTSYGAHITLTNVILAAEAVACGLANTVLVASAVSGSHAHRPSLVLQQRRVETSHGPQFDQPYGLSMPGHFALQAQRHMYQYGTTPEQLAKVSVTFREHAVRHPKAQMRQPITIEDVLKSRMIVDPLRLLMVCINSDGGWAFIVTTPERAKSMRQKPVYILGAGEAQGPQWHTSHTPDVTTAVGAREAADRAFAMAGVTRDDLDVAGLYDGAAIVPITQVEDLGFCKKGEGGPFVEAGHLALDGKLPTNTNGGNMSYAHGGRALILPHLYEVMLQLRGQADARQVKNAKLGLVAKAGIAHASCILILGTE